jgi:serine/threonine protein kinase
MSPERLRHIEELYHSACERPVDEREAFLQAACGGDAELLRQVRALVAQDAAEGPLERPVLQVAARLLEHGATALSPGTVLGPYRVGRRLGEGGMGDVYQARDTRLGRDVAIKTAKQEFSGRFQREARAISALNHPHICTLYDAGPNYLVMEYIDGAPIAGPLPVDRAVQLAAQIAAAVRHAHQHGVIHRDLKPGNILVTKAGVKVLDFGLAKLERTSATSSEVTGTQSMTEQGTILGTLRYMAPEQLKGTEADQRSDIFSFGVVLYEMLTGRPAFQGDSQADLIASLLKSEAEPITNFASGIPPALDHLIRTCLAKDPEERYQSMHDVLVQLEWITTDSGRAHSLPVAKKRSSIVAWLAAAVAAAALFTLALIHFREAPPETLFARFDIALPTKFNLEWWALPVISPDGKQLVFMGVADGRRMLWLRRMDSPEITPLPGTDSAAGAFWSSDSRYLAFWTEGNKLKKIDVNGGPPRVIANVPEGSFWGGGSWNSDGVILIGRSGGAICQFPRRRTEAGLEAG